MDGFYYDEGEPLRRPERVRRLVFEDLWKPGGEHAAAAGVVPLELIEEGDRQAGVFVRRGGGRRPGTWGPPASLDALASQRSVDSVVGIGPVVARTPLPHVRELSAGLTDAETLRNLPNLEWLSVGRGLDRTEIDSSVLPASVRWLRCGADTFGSPEAVIARLPHLERLAMHGLWEGRSVEPLAALAGLRWLQVDPGKGIQHLAKLEQLEVLDLDLVDGPRLANLTRLRRLSRLRVLRLVGSGVQGLEGVEQLAALEELSLERTAVDDLAPLAGHPALRSVKIEHAQRLDDLSPLGSLPLLRRLEVHLGAVDGDAELPSLGWLDGLRELEELTLRGVAAADGDPSPLYRLGPLRRATLVGAFGASEDELRARVRAGELLVVARGAPAPGVDVGPVSYRRLPDGTWTIFTNVTGALGVPTNLDAEDRIRGAIRDEDLALHDRLVFDSEPDALSISGASEEDIRRAAEVVAALAATH